MGVLGRVHPISPCVPVQLIVESTLLQVGLNVDLKAGAVEIRARCPLGVSVNLPRWKPVMGTFVVVQCHTDLLEVVGTFRPTGGLASSLHGGQK